MSEQNDSREIALREEKIPKLIMKMSSPAIVAMMVMSIYNVVDALFMGMLGTEALGAATIGYPYFMLLTALGLMFGMGGASYQSRLLGERRMDMAEKAIATVFISGAILGIAASILTVPFPETIARMFGANETLLAASSDYIWILSMGAVFPIVSMCANNLLRAEGSAMLSLVGMGVGSIINIVLDPILMFSLGMGVKGAALATVISQAISMFILLSYYFRGKTLVKLHFKQFSPNLKMYFEILKVGGAAFLQQLLTTITMALTNTVAAKLGGATSGEAVVAAVGAVNRISMLGYAVMIGFGQGLQPVIGYNYGAKQFTRMRKAISFAFLVSTIFGSAVALASFIFPEALAGLFSQSPDVIIPAAAGIRFLAFAWPVTGLFFVTQVLFQALGRSKQAIMLAVTRQLLLVICVYALSSLFGVMGLMGSLSLSMLLATILAVALYVPYHRELADLLKREADGEVLYEEAGAEA
jgi:putative MATE family efflux protein